MKISKIFEIVLIILFIIVTVPLVIGTIKQNHSVSTEDKSVKVLSNCTYKIDGQIESVTLPHNFKNLPHRKNVTIYAEFTPNKKDRLYVKTVYSPLKLYINDQLAYQCGQDGSFPSFLLDPPTMLAVIPLPDTEDVIQLRLEYWSPTQRDTLTVHPVLVAEESALTARVFKKNIFSLLFSLILIFMGIGMTLLSLIFVPSEKAILSFLWLGLFALATGIWVFGETNLTAFFIPYPSLLYLMAFSGLFTLTIPLLKFVMVTLNVNHKLPLLLMLWVNAISAIIALFLQLAGIMGLSRSMYFFHRLIPLTMVILAGYIIWESLRYNNRMAKRFILPMLTLVCFTLLEVLNYQMRFTNIMSLFFQFGVLLFVLMLGFIGSIFIRNALHMTSEKMRLEYEVKLMGHQLDTQRVQYESLTQNAEAVKAQRHDLRHQLAVIKHYNNEKENKKLNDYLDELLAKIPMDKDIVFCENSAVNAVVFYYISMAKAEGIEVSVKLAVPKDCRRVQDSDLCIILGNFLENALEACRRMKHGQQFIKLVSRVQYNILTFVMDNSFNGLYQEQDGIFLSQKTGKLGTGLSSVKAVAEKYGGEVLFQVNDDIFKSSVYVEMGNEGY